MTAAEWTTRTAWAGDLEDHPGAVALRRLRLEIDTERAYAALLPRCWYPMPGPPERASGAPDEFTAAVQRLHRSPEARALIRYAPHGLDVFAEVGGRWSTACLPYGGAS